MNLIERVFISLKSYKEKTFLFFCILFVLTNVIACCLAIQQETNRLEVKIKNSLGSVVSLEDGEYTAENYVLKEDRYISVDTIEKIGEFSEVNIYNYIASFIYFSDTIRNVEVSGYADENGNFPVLVTGTQIPEILDLEQGNGELISGRTFTKSEIDNGQSVIVITEQFANQNGLSLGSNFELENIVSDYISEDNLAILEIRKTNFEVVGIYRPKLLTEIIGASSEERLKVMNLNDYRVNTQYVPNNLITNEVVFQEDIVSLNRGEIYQEYKSFHPIFILNSPDEIENFVQKVREFIPKDMVIKTSLDDYEKIAGPISSYKLIASITLWVSIFITVIILSLIIMINNNDRKFEFGILLSLGDNKIKIIGQVLLEIILVASLAVSFSLISGTFLAKAINMSNTSENINSVNEIQNTPSYSLISIYGYENDVDRDEIISDYQIDFSIKYIVTYYLIILITIVFVTIIPIYRILKLNPKKILMMTD